MLEQVGLLGWGNKMPKATIVREELNEWHSTTVQFSCGSSTSYADEYPVPLGKRREVSACLSEYLCSLIRLTLGGGTYWLGNTTDAVSPKLLSGLLLFLSLSFDQCYLRKAITLTSQQDWCPGQRLQHFPSQEAMWWLWQWQAQSTEPWKLQHCSRFFS